MSNIGIMSKIDNIKFDHAVVVVDATKLDNETMDFWDASKHCQNCMYCNLCIISEAEW